MNETLLADDNRVYLLTITSNTVSSDDEHFSMNDLKRGSDYEPVNAYYVSSGTKEKTFRKKTRGEWKTANRTLPKLAFQIYEDKIASLSEEERKRFGIFYSVDDYINAGNRNRRGTFTYKNNNRQFVISYWDIFSTIPFVQKCLSEFDVNGSSFCLEYKIKEQKGKNNSEEYSHKHSENDFPYPKFISDYSSMLTKSKNIILHGAPGTGKSYLAKKIAADIVSNGTYDDYSKLSDALKQQIEFVQFHPSYDYTDFVEGLRPKLKDGSIVFELQDGIFKNFISRARENYEKSPKDAKNYVFIIDEINRGEISNIFGELFFAIDPGYRGKAGEISTQYANMHSEPNDKFYIPENVFIIGTMNDIDKSVDSFDFAMRRRFRFIHLKANECTDMLDVLNEGIRTDALHRMNNLNEVIANTEGLNEDYQIGASYFLKLQDLKPDQLWLDYLQPLLQEYVRGLYDETSIMRRFAEAYGFTPPAQGDANDAAQN